MLVECWQWSYRDPLTGGRRTTQQPNAEEVAAFPEANKSRGPRATGSRKRSLRKRSLRYSGRCLTDPPWLRDLSDGRTSRRFARPVATPKRVMRAVHHCIAPCTQPSRPPAWGLCARRASPRLLYVSAGVFTAERTPPVSCLSSWPRKRFPASLGRLPRLGPASVTGAAQQKSPPTQFHKALLMLALRRVFAKGAQRARHSVNGTSNDELAVDAIAHLGRSVERAVPSFAAAVFPAASADNVPVIPTRGLVLARLVFALAGSPKTLTEHWTPPVTVRYT